MTSQGKVHSLTIDELLVEHQGVYTCQLKVNGKTTQATLKVKEMPADFALKLGKSMLIVGTAASTKFIVISRTYRCNCR
jgi:hypothetical protein